jgi:beta-glucanase (GH16 family)
MSKHFGFFLISFIALLISSCKKNETAAVIEPVKVAPTNLVINATVSTDGSGKVAFTAKADNANFYRFEFGNGETIDEPTGVVNYRYTDLGTKSYTVTVIANSSSGLSISKTKEISVTVDFSQLMPVWSDEFNTNGSPDASKWVYDIGTGSNGWGNVELQYYTDRQQNAIVEGGYLKIKAQRESFSGSSWTSARLKSLGKFALTYGTVVVRAKMPAGVGTWPAIWMLGADFPTVGWPNCGEIDIAEHVGKEKDKIFASLHYPGRTGGNAVTGTKFISNATTQFHEYKLDWTASSLKFYVDDVVFHTVVNSGNIPFNKDFFFLLNLAIGGNFGGPVDPSINNVVFEIDYIRVYK